MARNIFSVDLPDATVSQRFDEFLGPRGTKKGHAVRGAIELFMILPAGVREMLIRGEIDAAKAWLSSGAARELESVLDAAKRRESRPGRKAKNA